MDRHISNDEVRLDQKREHIFPDIARFHEFARGAASELETFERGRDQLIVDPVEIYGSTVGILLGSQTAGSRIRAS